MKGVFEDPRKIFGSVVSDLAMQNETIVILSADSGKSSGFGDFAKAAPDRYFECGIMEQGVTGIASGLATTGKIPVFCAIAPFVTARPYEMFRNDLGYMRQNVKMVGRNGGITYSTLGSTHHSLDDFGLMRLIPGVTILCPQDPDEIRGAAKAMIEMDGPVYMRIGNAKIPGLFDAYPDFVVGKGRKITEGTEVTIVSTGSLTGSAMLAAEKLVASGISVDHIGLPTVWPLDESLILASAKKTGRIVVVEEHYRDGGLGTMIADICSEKYPVPVLKLGIPNTYASSGPYDELLAYYGLDAPGIFESVRSFI